MSMYATAWAMTQPAGSPLERLLLILLADCADDDGLGRVDLARLAERAVCDAVDLADAVADLQERGIIALGGTAEEGAAAVELCLVPLWRASGSPRRPIATLGKRRRA